MNLVELCCFRLAERGIISQEGARVLVTLYRRGPLNGVELAEWSGVEIGGISAETAKLQEIGAIRCICGKYFNLNISEALFALIPNEEMQKKARIGQLLAK